MRKKYGYKDVVTSSEFYEGYIVENKENKVVCRRYYKNEYQEKQVEDVADIDIVQVARYRTPISQMRCITSQLGISNYAIDQKVINNIKFLTN